MPNIISNTSCLIVLDNIGMLTVLKELYENIAITEEIALEFGKIIPDWILIEKVFDKKSLIILNSIIDPGEASTIALCIEKNNSIMILDDLKARKLSKKLELKFTGTIGVLLKAKNQGIIKNMEIVLAKFKQNGFRMPPDIEEKY